VRRVRLDLQAQLEREELRGRPGQPAQLELLGQQERPELPAR
jgi:hypothetical protein